MFYLKFIDGRIFQETEVWNRLSQTQAYKTWSGYAFENICLKHIRSIKKALGISGIYSEVASFYRKGEDGLKGVRIDLVIDRNDHIINLFEIKFYNAPFVITKEYATQLRQKITLFKAYSKTNKQIFISLISSFGIIENEYSLGCIHHSLTIDDLFD